MTTEAGLVRDHIAGCPKPGFRYAATVRSNAATRASGTAGKVVLLCKGVGCGATKHV